VSRTKTPHSPASALLIALTALTALAPAHAAETRSAAPGATPPRARLADLEWLVGTWSGAGIENAPAMEAWSPAADGQLVGHFRQLHADGKIWFYEIMTLVPRGDSLELRLKHFNADLTAWEEKNEVMSFPLVAVDGNTWYFDGLTLRREQPNSLRYFVRIQHQDGKTEEIEFRLSRS
jgi:hypothetical protein